MTTENLSADDPWTGLFAPTLADLASRFEGWRVRGRLARGRCPCCDSRTGGWALVRDDGHAAVGCHACGDRKAIASAFRLDVARARPLRFHLSRRISAESHAPDMVEDAVLLDRVYRVLLRHLAMTGDQRRNVLGRDRGISAALRERMSPLLGPVPSDRPGWRARHAAIVDALAAAAPVEFLRRVPDLAARENGSYAILPSLHGAQYFEPWTDEEGRVVALRAYMGKRGESKYLVSKGRTGPMVHFAFGVDRARAGEVPWVFTEGWMKAEVLAHQFGCVGVAFPGVNARHAWPRAIDALQRLAPDAPTYVAFDSEVWKNRLDLAIHAVDLAGQIQGATGRPAGFAVWDAELDAHGKPQPKGIDDAIVAGATVRLVDRETFGAHVGPLVEAWELSHAA